MRRAHIDADGRLDLGDQARRGGFQSMHRCSTVVRQQVIPSQHLTTVTGSHTEGWFPPMHLQPTWLMSRVATVLLIVAAASAPCTITAAAAPIEPPAVTTPRQLVTDTMTWLVPTATGWQPAEHAQPTLWLEGHPHTRYVVEKPGVEKALLFGKER